ncbi:MAG: LptA/OstA family protein [Pseudomonadota bacterium]
MRNSIVPILTCALIVGYANCAAAQVSSDGGPIRVNADRSEVLERENKVILIDNVDITQGDARLRADVVTLAFGPGQGTTASGVGSGFGDIRTMTARGNVFYVTPDLKARGDFGTYDAQTDTITLTGNVTLVRGEDVGTGERLTLQLSEGRTVLDPKDGEQVNIVIIPIESETQ